MADHEDIEKVRQEIMRFRELMNIVRLKLDEGERAYAQLFVSFTPEEKQKIKEKDLQWKAAEIIADDVTPLRNAVGTLRFNLHNMDIAFEELYNIIVSPAEEH